MGVCGGQVVDAEAKTHLVHIGIVQQRLVEYVECICGALLAWHDIGVGDDEMSIETQLGDEPTEPRAPMTKVHFIEHHVMRGGVQEVHHGLVRTGVVTEPDVFLPHLFQPGE